MKKIIFFATIFVMLKSIPAFAGIMSQEEIDQINMLRQIEAENEIARVKEAAEQKSQNELDAARKTADAFAEDVQRRRDAYEDWVDDQRVLAGLEPIYDDNKTDLTNENADVVTNTDESVVEDQLPDIEECANDTPDIIIPEEFDLFCRIVEAEAPSEGLKGKIMVANVILNRVASPYFPNTVSGVIMAPGQFSPVRSGKINRVVVTEETKIAVQNALNGESYAGAAMFFRSARRGSTFLGKNCIATSGGNNFYL